MSNLNASVPMTFCIPFSLGTTTQEERIFRYYLHECSTAGMKHLVLTDGLIREILRAPSLYLEMLKKIMDEEGLDFLDSHSPFGGILTIGNPEQQTRPVMLSIHKSAMEIAACYGVKTITMHLDNSRLPLEQYPVDALIDWTCRSLDVLLPEAQRLGITLCIENIDAINNQPAALLKIKERFPEDTLGFTYDSGHANLIEKGKLYTECRTRNVWKRFSWEGEPIWETDVLGQMLPHIVIAHLTDNDGSDDHHTIPGRGNCDWDNIISSLQQAPRLQVVQSEVSLIHAGVSIREVVDSFSKFPFSMQ